MSLFGFRLLVYQFASIKLLLESVRDPLPEPLFVLNGCDTNRLLKLTIDIDCHFGYNQLFDLR
jgi:hypothetical protein